MNILLGVTGSVASIYTHKLVNKLLSLGHDVKVIKTKSAIIDYSIKISDSGSYNIYHDISESWSKLGDPILHIELRKWADIFIIAPLSMNTLAKIANGLCDNLLTDVVRAWDFRKPIFVCPAANTHMWNSKLTNKHLAEIKDLGIQVIYPVEKLLACGDFGVGAMCHHDDIINVIPKWESPFKKSIFIPTGEHPGAFGVQRKYDIHTGVDLYCEDGQPVYAVEDSYFVEDGWFTGKKVNMPWWNNTKYVVMKGKSGYVLYGEIDGPVTSCYRRNINAGDLIGYVKAVLPPEKKRSDIPHHSNAMLHIELYKEFENWVSWNHNTQQPDYLLNPTPYLKTI